MEPEELGWNWNRTRVPVSPCSQYTSTDFSFWSNVPRGQQLPQRSSTLNEGRQFFHFAIEYFKLRPLIHTRIWSLTLRLSLCHALSEGSLYYIARIEPHIRSPLLEEEACIMKAKPRQTLSKDFPLTVHGIKVSIRYHFRFSCVEHFSDFKTHLASIAN